MKGMVMDQISINQCNEISIKQRRAIYVIILALVKNYCKSL